MYRVVWNDPWGIRSFGPDSKERTLRAFDDIRKFYPDECNSGDMKLRVMEESEWRKLDAAR